MPNPKGNIATLKHYKPKWKAGVTQTIRVPVALANELLDYAHKLDNGLLTQVDTEPNNQNETLTQVLQVLTEVCETPHTSKFTKVLKAKIQTEAIERLKHLLQVNKDV